MMPLSWSMIAVRNLNFCMWVEMGDMNVVQHWRRAEKVSSRTLLAYRVIKPASTKLLMLINSNMVKSRAEMQCK